MSEKFVNGTFPVYRLLVKEDFTPYLFTEKRVADVLGNRVTTGRIYRLLSDEFKMDELMTESLFVVSLNTSGKVVGIFEVSKGSVGATPVPLCEIFRGCLLCGGSRLVLAHNHPDGRVAPSDADVVATRHLIEAGKLLGVTIEDHIIVGRGGDYHSFREKNSVLWA